MKIFTYMGDVSKDYRGLMKKHTDFVIEGKTIPVRRTVICEQTHSNRVHVVCEDEAGAGWNEMPQIPIADGLITNIPGLYLLIRTADCFPVVIYDEKKCVVAAIHSGREGTRQNIVVKAIDRFVADFECIPEDLKAIIGAGICQKHYEVDEGTWLDFNQSLMGIQAEPLDSAYRHIDIRRAIRMQLLSAGLVPENIEEIEVCTFESPNYFSYRRDGTLNRQINLIGVCND